MAFINKIGKLLKHSAVKCISPEFSASTPSIYQAIRSMSSAKLFIGGVSYSTDDMGLREAFARYGEIIDARVIMDRETGRSRGFGFITFASSEEASAAIQAMDGQDLDGRRIRVNYATDRARPGFGGGGGYGGGGYGGGSYGGGSYGGGGYGGGYGRSNYGGGDNFRSPSYGSGGDGFGGGGNYGAPDGAGGSNYQFSQNSGGGDLGIEPSGDSSMDDVGQFGGNQNEGTGLDDEDDLKENNDEDNLRENR